MNEWPPTPDPDRTEIIPGPRAFGRYTLIGVVGEGGMGVVWRARDEMLERDVALKFLPDRVRHDPEAVRDLKRETRRCLDLTHPNIVRVHDFVEDGRAAAIAMEYVPGKSLSALKAARPSGCFDPADLAPLVVQLCAALDYAHVRARVVHRDLKPANLLVTTDGVLKVADFGIARSLSETQARHTAGVRRTMGTLVFMSPQQLAGQEAATADDIYALGATLYDLLTGRPPFFRGDLYHQIQVAAPEALAVRRAGLQNSGGPIAPEWEQTILACLAKDAARRPATAGEVAARLGAAGTAFRPEAAVEPPLDGGRDTTVAIAPPAPPTYPDKMDGASRAGGRRHRRAAALALVGVIVVAVAAGWFSRVKPDEGQATEGLPRVRSPGFSRNPAPDGQGVPADVEIANEEARRPEPSGPKPVFQEGTPSAPLTTEPSPPAAEAPREPRPSSNSVVPTAVAPPISPAVQPSEAPLTVEVALPVAPPPATQRESPAHSPQIPEPKPQTPEPKPETPSSDSRVSAPKSAIRDPQSAIPNPAPGRPWTIPDLDLVLQPIAAGTFTMGNVRGSADEKPLTRVTFTRPFWLGRTEVTQREWAAVMGTRPAHFRGEDRPVEHVSWTDAMDFCRKLTEQERAAERLPAGYVYGLPTEAQWEYACQAGKSGDYGGNLGEMAWYGQNSGKQTHPVGTKRPNAWGLCDMHGNVLEWCADWSGNYPGGSVRDYAGPARGSYRVVRGGSWGDVAADCRSTYRNGNVPENRSSPLGFRVALTPQG